MRNRVVIAIYLDAFPINANEKTFVLDVHQFNAVFRSVAGAV